MRILAVVQGNYGRRIVNHIEKYGPSHWEIEVCSFPPTLPPIIDEPEQFLPRSLPSTDLLLSLGESRGVAELIPSMVEMSGTTMVIAPVDNRDWLPPGLASQVKARLASLGVEVVFPVPFCALEGKNGYHPYLLQFAEYFGMPGLRLACNAGKIEGVIIKREAPCGCTRAVAEGLIGSRINDAPEKAGLLHHHSCLASVEIDWQFGDSLMHRAAFKTMLAVKQAIRNF